MRAIVCSDLALLVSRDQAPHKSHEHCYPILPVGKLRHPGLVTPLDILQQVFAMMLEEHPDREAHWCCLHAVGKVLFLVTGSSFPKSHSRQRGLCSRRFASASGLSPGLSSLSISPAFLFHFITPLKPSILSVPVSPDSSCSPTALRLSHNTNHSLIH